MRSLLAVCLLAAGADARPAPQRPPPAESNFWRDIIEPHGEQVHQLLLKARAAMQQPETAALSGDADWAVDQRGRYYRDAYNLMRYARRLSPQNVEVLALYARAADELGQTRDAIDALETAVRITGLDKASSDVCGRLGAIYLRLGDRETAIRWLRQSQATPTAGAALVHLANALAAKGDITGAVDALQNALPTRAPGFFFASEASIVAFALAVVYDRDEQRAEAYDVLDHMKHAMNTQYATQVGNELTKLRFAPAEDEHYYRALFYESLEHYTEARAEWALYAASGDATWRARALDHVAAIDALRRSAPKAKPPVDPPLPKPWNIP